MSISPPSYPISLQDTTTGETLVIAALDGHTDVPVVVQSLQTPGPDVREVAASRPNQDGVDDQTRFHGARPATLALTIPPNVDAHAVEDRLVAWCDPARRSYLVVQRTGWPAVRRMLIRGDQFGAPTTFAGPTIQMLLAWKAPDGVWESAEEYSTTIFPGGSSTGALTLPFTLPFNLGSGIPSGAGQVSVGGTKPTPPTIRIYGPITAPAIRNQTAGKTIQFKSSYSVPAGQYIEIQSVPQFSVQVNGDGESRFGNVDWANTTPWLLLPGNNFLSLSGSGVSAVTQAVVLHHERYL